MFIFFVCIDENRARGMTTYLAVVNKASMVIGNADWFNCF